MGYVVAFIAGAVVAVIVLIAWAAKKNGLW